MSKTVKLPPPMHKRPLTAADVARLPSELPSGPVRYELIDGELRVMPPTGGPHGGAQPAVSGYLFVFGQLPGHGKVLTETGLLLSRSPDTLVGPDVMFYSRARMPVRWSREDYALNMPDLVVEVRSPNDSWPEVTAKIALYLNAGVPLVWVVDPHRELLHVHAVGSDPVTLQANDPIDFGPLAPGLRLIVRDLFGIEPDLNPPSE